MQDIEHPPFYIKPIKPTQNKIARFVNNSGILSAGKVWVLKHVWKNDIRDEVLNFPNAKHDDVIDTISQFFGFIRDNKKALKIKFL